MKYIKLLIGVLIFVGCSMNNESKKITQEKHSEIKETNDSALIVKTAEYLRLIEFLHWYRDGHKELFMPRIEKYFESDSQFYAYIDTIEAQILLRSYRESGYFTHNRIEKDSLYIEKAKKVYRDKNLEIYDYFDHDFILLTQEIEGTLNAIPNTYLLPEYCDIKSGKIAISIGDYMNLRYTIKNEEGQYKIDDIENLGIIK